MTGPYNKKSKGSLCRLSFFKTVLVFYVIIGSFLLTLEIDYTIALRKTKNVHNCDL